LTLGFSLSTPLELIFIKVGLKSLTRSATSGMEVMHERNAHNFPLDLA